MHKEAFVHTQTHRTQLKARISPRGWTECNRAQRGAAEKQEGGLSDVSWCCYPDTEVVHPISPISDA